jgi:molybdate transport system regulatory protein
VGGRLKTRLWLEVDGRFVLGDGGVQLLLGVRRDGSLAAAVRRIGWSYRHAWGYLRRAEAVLGAPLTAARAGKGRARGAVLTGLGDRIVAQLLEARDRIDRVVGPSGPTRREIAARGRVSRRLPPPSAPRSGRTAAGRTSRRRRP